MGGGIRGVGGSNNGGGESRVRGCTWLLQTALPPLSLHTISHSTNRTTPPSRSDTHRPWWIDFNASAPFFIATIVSALRLADSIALTCVSASTLFALSSGHRSSLPSNPASSLLPSFLHDTTLCPRLFVFCTIVHRL